jgi:hypothetical protein
LFGIGGSSLESRDDGLHLRVRGLSVDRMEVDQGGGYCTRYNSRSFKDHGAQDAFSQPMPRTIGRETVGG